MFLNLTPSWLLSEFDLGFFVNWAPVYQNDRIRNCQYMISFTCRWRSWRNIWTFTCFLWTGLLSGRTTTFTETASPQVTDWILARCRRACACCVFLVAVDSVICGHSVQCGGSLCTGVTTGQVGLVSTRPLSREFVNLVPPDFTF